MPLVYKANELTTLFLDCLVLISCVSVVLASIN